MSADRFQRIGEFCEQSGSAALLIIREGKCVYAWGNVQTRYPTHSMRKALLNGLYGIYVDRGVIDTLATLADLNIDDISPKLSETEKQAEVRDLLASRSGVYHQAAAESESMVESRPERGSHPHGTYFYYNNWDFNVLGTIFERVTGKTVFDAFDEEFAVPLGMRHYSPKDGRYLLEEDKSVHPAYHIWMNAYDLALYGLLFQANGVWNGRQIISQDWIKASTTYRSEYIKDVGLGYGWLWYVFSEDAGLGRAFMTTGDGIHMLAVFKDLDLVVVHRVDSERKASEITFTGDNLYQLFGMVVDAVTNGQ
ncbi:MAG: serine hydrolase [candidate division Zixibacteria bacterium]|nr:serine hydrolase [candidate division Zixibacteria bacterium]